MSEAETRKEISRLRDKAWRARRDNPGAKGHKLYSEINQQALDLEAKLPKTKRKGKSIAQEIADELAKKGFTSKTYKENGTEVVELGPPPDEFEEIKKEILEGKK